MPSSSSNLENREYSSDPVIGDGVITVPDPREDGTAMPGFDLPDGLAAQLASETGANINSTAHMGRTLQQQAGAAMTAVITRIPTEPSVIGGRAVSGVLATPIASPTQQAG